MKHTARRGRGAFSALGTLPTVAALALLLALTGCSGGTIFGRPRSYTELADDVTVAFNRDRYDRLKDLVITNEDRSRMGEETAGDPREPYVPAEETVHDSWKVVRDAGANAGILWNEVTMTSAVALGAHNKFKERVDVKVNLDSRGNRYQILIKNAQLVDNGDIVLTDRIQWIGEP